MRAIGAAERGLRATARVWHTTEPTVSHGISRRTNHRTVPSRHRGLAGPPVRGADRRPGARVAVDRGRRGRAGDRADGLRQDARGLPRVPRPPGEGRDGGRARGSHARAVRVAAEGAVERHPRQPRAAARRDRRAGRGDGLPAPAHSHRRPHRRHHRARAAGRREASAAHPGHHAGVVLHLADQRVGSQGAARRAHRDHRRDSRGRARQARRPPGPVARAARRAHARAGAGIAARRRRGRDRRRCPCAHARATCAAAARGPVGDGEPDRGRGTPAVRLRAAGAAHRERVAATRSRPGDRAAARRAGSGVHQRPVGRDL